MEKTKATKNIILMVGMSGVGKTSYIRNHPQQFAGYTVLSRYQVLKEYCAEKSRELGVEVPPDSLHDDSEEMGKVYALLDRKFQEALAHGDNIVIDSINNTPAIRARWLDPAKASAYTSTAIIIHPPEESVHVERLLKRAIKERRFQVLGAVHLRQMIPVQPDEAFDQVIQIGNLPEKPMLHAYANPPDTPIDKLLRKPPEGRDR